MDIIKRNGDRVPFDKKKIVRAVENALIDVDKYLYETDTANDIADDIESFYLKHPTYQATVEEVQDMVEDLLMRSERKDVAKSYIRFRYKREVAREVKTDFFEAFGEKLKASNVQNQNANVDEYSFGGRIGEASSVMTKKYALENIVSKMAKKNHLNNEIYIHDLDSYAVGSHNCLSIPFDDLLANGFNTRQTDVRPAKSINTAFQLVAVLFQLQSLQQFGGVSATHLDWTMVPYVRMSFVKHWKDGIKYIELTQDSLMSRGEEEAYLALDENYDNLSIESDEFQKWNLAYKYALDMTERELEQAVEGMYHNLNTLQSRSGNQLKWMAG